MVQARIKDAIYQTKAKAIKWFYAIRHYCICILLSVCNHYSLPIFGLCPEAVLICLLVAENRHACQPVTNVLYTKKFLFCIKLDSEKYSEHWKILGWASQRTLTVSPSVFSSVMIFFERLFNIFFWKTKWWSCQRIIFSLESMHFSYSEDWLHLP